MFSERKGGRRENNKGGKKGLLQVEVHGSADHPFAKCCSDGALRGAETSAAMSLLGKAVRPGHLRGACLRETAMGE